MKALLIRFLKDDSAATAVEYSILGALISMLVVTMIIVFGADLQTLIP